MSDETIKLKPTDRGFLRGEFVDRYGSRCSIQESSLATEGCIWLGVDEEPQYHHVTGQYLGARMHLSREQAEALIPLLEHFVETGRLPRDG